MESVPRVTNALTFAEMGINLDSLLLIQGLGTRHVSDPFTRHDLALLNQRPVKANVSNDQITVTVRGELIYKRNRLAGESKKEWNEHIDHLRHDYVASMLQDCTDTNLSLLGVNTNLTPDKIHVPTKKVLELATTVSQRPQKLEEDYKKKRLTYASLCQAANAMLTILCVSASAVYTNCAIRTDMISEFCRRLREAASFELEISNETGRMPNQGGEDADEDIKAMDDIFREIRKLPKNVSWDFNQDLELLSMSPQTESSKKKCVEILDSTWKKSAEFIEPLPNSAMEDYIDGLEKQATRSDKKRCMQFPAATPEPTLTSSDPSSFVLDLDKNWEHLSEEARVLAKLWNNGLHDTSWFMDGKTEEEIKKQSLREAYGHLGETEQHGLRKRSTFLDNLDEQDRLTLALSGPGAKALDNDPVIQDKSSKSHESFSLRTSVSDIEEFLKGDMLTKSSSKARELSAIHDILKNSKKTKRKRHVARDMHAWCSDLGISRYSQFVSDLSLELCYEYKTAHAEGTWSCKAMRNHDVLVLFKATGTHVFFSVAMKMEGTDFWDTEKIGSKMHRVGNFAVSEMSSLVEANLDHFIKAGPYITSLSAYMLQHFKIPFLTQKIEVPKEYWQTLKCMFLIYFNNKMDLQKMLLDCRYLYMKVLQRFENDPYLFIERLPDVYRSRVSVCFGKRLITLMMRMRFKKPKQVRVKGLPERDPNSVKFVGLKCIFHECPIQLDQLIDTFYFGYTVSKYRGNVGDKSYKIVKKIIAEELWARENIKQEANHLWREVTKPERQRWSYELSSLMIDILKYRWKKIHGENFDLQLKRLILQDMNRQTFSDIATLKASSRNVEDPQLVLPSVTELELKGQAYINRLNELNPELGKKRPRVITSLIIIIEDYIRDTGDDNPTLPKMLPYCLQRLNKRNFFFSDCFGKDQYGGEREIHVVEISARIIQYFVERCARCMGFMFPSDTVLNPKKKEVFMQEHENSSQAVLGAHMTVCKSADASKWCQRHHVSKFYFFMNRLTGGHFNDFFYHSFQLWTVKRVAIPSHLVSVLQTADLSNSTNETLKDLRKRFLRGEEPFVLPGSHTLEVKFGMFQGIFHRVSSVVHSVCQEFFAALSRERLKKESIKAVVSVVQGSDDSAACISYRDTSLRNHAIIHALLKWKESFQEYISIWPSKAKSSVGTLLLVEYNSEWWYRGKIIKPTFRWVSACLETKLVEHFYERMQLFYDGLTTAVEVGVCTLTASVIQRCQAHLHYMMMGFSNHILRREAAELLLDFPHPSLGFFPLDEEEHCGVTGFDYALYVHTRESDITQGDIYREQINPTSSLDYDEKLDKSLRRSLMGAKITFGSRSIWERFVEELSIGTIQECVDHIDDNPGVLYNVDRSWQAQKMYMTMKVFEPGVISSMSSHQPLCRGSASSSYLFNRPCLKVRLAGGNWKRKVSLMDALDKNDKYREVTMLDALTAAWGDSLDESKLRDALIEPGYQGDKLFLFQEQYADFFDIMEDFKNHSSYQQVPYGRHSRALVPVWESITLTDNSVMDLAKRKWHFFSSVSVNRTTFQLLWSECRAKYRFLRDTYEETLRETGLDHLGLFDLLSTLTTKKRTLTLQDTTAKSSGVLGAITRIYWPQIKLRTQTQDVTESYMNFRHMSFCAVSFFFSLKQKKRIIKQLYSKSGLQQVSLRECPNRMRRMKVIGEYLINGNKEEFIKNVPRVKNGVIGFFSVAGERLKGADTSTKFQGKGVWVGSVNNVATRIDIVDSHVSQITLQNMSDSSNLSQRLGQLLLELRLTPLPSTQTSESLFYLNPTGNFNVSTIALKDCVCIEIEKELEVPDLDNLKNKEWDVMIDGTTLKVVYLEPIDDDRNRNVTILSETFMGRDWSPELTSSDLSWTRSRSFSKFCRGEGCSIYDVLEDIKVNPDSKHMSSIISRMGVDEYTLSHFSLQALKKSLKSYIISREASKLQKLDHEKKGKEDERNALAELDFNEEDVENLRAFAEGEEDDKLGNSYVDALASRFAHDDVEDEPMLEDESIADRDEEWDDDPFDSLNDANWDVSKERLESIAYLLYEEGEGDAYEELSQFEAQREMPKENVFWSDLLDLVKAEKDGESIIASICGGTAVSSGKSLLSHAAFFISLVCDQNVFSDHVKSLSTDTEKTVSMSSRDPIVNEDDIPRHIEGLHQKISSLANTIPSVEGYVKALLERKKEELEIQLEGYESQDLNQPMEEISYYEYMSSLLLALKTQSIYDKSDQTSDLEIQSTMLISHVLETSIAKNKYKQISDSDLSLMRSRIWDRVFSPSFNRFMSIGLSCVIEVKKENKRVCIYMPRGSLNEVTVEL